MSLCISTTLEIDGEKKPVYVHYIHCREQKGKTDGKYGPKLEPDEPEHLEIDWVEDSAGNSIEITSRQEDSLLGECADDYEGRCEPSRDRWEEE